MLLVGADGGAAVVEPRLERRRDAMIGDGCTHTLAFISRSEPGVYGKVENCDGRWEDRTTDGEHSTCGDFDRPRDKNDPHAVGFVRLIS